MIAASASSIETALSRYSSRSILYVRSWEGLNAKLAGVAWGHGDADERGIHEGPFADGDEAVIEVGAGERGAAVEGVAANDAKSLRAGASCLPAALHARR